MNIYKGKDSTFVISDGGTWLTGCYESERVAELAFKISDEARTELQDNANSRGTGIITMRDINKVLNKRESKE